MEIVYYRSCGEPSLLYRVEAPEVPAAPGGGLDLSAVPAGPVSVWTGSEWAPAVLPPVGSAPDCVRHTKNVARVGA